MQLSLHLCNFLDRTTTPLSAIELSLLTNSSAEVVEEELRILKQEGKAKEIKKGAWVSSSPLYSEELISAVCSKIRQILDDRNFEFMQFSRILSLLDCDAVLVEVSLQILKKQGVLKSTTRNRWALTKPKIVRTTTKEARRGYGWIRRPKEVLDALRFIPQFAVEGDNSTEPCTTARKFLHANKIQPPAIIKVTRGDANLFYWGEVGLFSFSYFEQSPLSFPEVRDFLKNGIKTTKSCAASDFE